MGWGRHLVNATLLLGPGSNLNDATTGGDVWMIISFLYLIGGLEHEFYFSIYWECHHPN
jgi:hypothetical protein